MQNVAPSSDQTQLTWVGMATLAIVLALLPTAMVLVNTFFRLPA